MKINHYVEKGWKHHSSAWLSEEEYSKVLDTIVFACVDIILTYENKVLLAKRNVEPQKDWWIIGGRMFPGESPQETAVRKVKASRLQSIGSMIR